MSYVSSGDLDCMRVLFERYHAWIFNFFMQMVRDREASEDLVQSTFYKAIKYRNSYHGGKFASWIFQIARNLSSDYFKKQKSKFSHEPAEHIPEDAQELDGDEDVVKLKLVMQKLPASDREILVMSKFQEMRYAQIAEVLKSTETAVKIKVHRALKKLRKLYFESVEI